LRHTERDTSQHLALAAMKAHIIELQHICGHAVRLRHRCSSRRANAASGKDIAI
jgi:hypothetical protein